VVFGGGPEARPAAHLRGGGSAMRLSVGAAQKRTSKGSENLRQLPVAHQRRSGVLCFALLWSARRMATRDRGRPLCAFVRFCVLQTSLEHWPGAHAQKCSPALSCSEFGVCGPGQMAALSRRVRAVHLCGARNANFATQDDKLRRRVGPNWRRPN